MFRSLARRLRDESGIALVMGIGVTLTSSAALVGVRDRRERDDPSRPDHDSVDHVLLSGRRLDRPGAALRLLEHLGFWYVNAAPGPRHPCDPATRTGTPPTFDTGDETINGSATPVAPFDLTPTTSYTCKVSVGGTVVGELSWNASARVLTVNGTVFIDGSANFDRTGFPGGTVFTYAGSGTIYLSGTFAIKSTIMCAVVSGSDCNFAAGAWNPNDKVLVVVADGDGGWGTAQSQGNVVDPGIGIQLVSSSFQGALIANKAIGGGSSTTSKIQGPIVSVYGEVVAGQSGAMSFPSLNWAPSGTGGLTGSVPAGKLLAPLDYAG